VAGIQFQANS